MGKRPFVGFTRDYFAQAARIFWNNGYRAVDQFRDMGPNESGLSPQETKRDARWAVEDIGFTPNHRDFFAVRAERSKKGG